MSKKIAPIVRASSETYIRKWRKHLGLTLAEVAKRVDASEPTLSRIETGASTLTWPSLNAIAQALGVDPYDLLLRNPENDSIESLFSEIRAASEEKQALVARVVRTILDE